LTTKKSGVLEKRKSKLEKMENPSHEPNESRREEEYENN